MKSNQNNKAITTKPTETNTEALLELGSSSEGGV